MSLSSVILAGALALAPSDQFRGQAQVDGQLSYIEEHSLLNCQPVCEQQNVRYLDANGQLFAQKELLFINSRSWQPDYRFTDLRFNSSERSWIEGDRLYLEVTRDGDTQNTQLALSANLVVDAGFHPFVQHHLPSLLANESISFDFLSSAQMDTIGFRLRLIEQTEQQAVIALQLQNRLLRTFVSDIKLVYNLSDGRLLSYDGLTNIRRDQGRGNYNAFIRYSY